MSGQDEGDDAILFEIVDVYGRLAFDRVYENGLHALQRIHIRNLTDQPLVIRMRSNLGNQLTFQTSNENLLDWDIGQHTTNTVTWATHLFASPHAVSPDTCVNEIFNMVNWIDELTLQPYETVPLILGFLPNVHDDDDDPPPTTATSSSAATPTLNGPSTASSSATGISASAAPSGLSKPSRNLVFNHDSSETDTFNWYNVIGSVFFFGYLDITSALPDYQVSVKLRADVCQSLLWTDVMETGIAFEDCVLGETYHQEFTIKNKSDIDLYWTMNTLDLVTDWLTFADVISGECFDSHVPIEGCCQRRIRVTFAPKEVGEFNYDLQLENLNDARNVVQIKIHAVVRSIAHKESIVVSSGSVIDFADCVSGQWAVQQLVLNNVADHTMEVRFLPEGAEVVFDIKSSFDPATLSPVDDPEQAGPASSLGTSLDPASNITVSSSASSSANSIAPALPTPAATVTSTSEISTVGDSDYSRSASPISMEYPGSLWSGGVRVHAPSVASNRSVTDYENKTQPPVQPVENYTRIEDLLLKPGKERVVQVSYRPQKDANVTDFNAGQLIRRQFRIVLEYARYRSTDVKERKAVQCRARTCTSFVEAVPKEISFGDTDVGTQKSLPINIVNRSDIPARVELEFASKVLNCQRGEITIQPRSYVELRLDLYPRKVNPEYRKQITLVNYLNHDNDQIIEVLSNNIDKNRVTFHSLFYRILTTTGANYLDFGAIALNSPSLRTFTVENIRQKPLTLEITTSKQDELKIYVKRKRPRPDATAQQPNISITEVPDSPRLPTTSSLSSQPPAAPAPSSTNSSKPNALDLNSDTTQSSCADIVPVDTPTDETSTKPNKDRRLPLRDLLLDKHGHHVPSEQPHQERMVRAGRAMYSSAAYLDLATSPLPSSKRKRRMARAIHLKELDAGQFLQRLKSSGTNSTTLPSSAAALSDGTNERSRAHTALTSPTTSRHDRSSSAPSSTTSATNQASPSPLHRSLFDQRHRQHLKKSSQDKTDPTSSSSSSSLSSTPALPLTSTSVGPKRHHHHHHHHHHHRHRHQPTLSKSSSNKQISKQHRTMGLTAARYRSRKHLDWSDISGKSQVPLEDLLTVMEQSSKAGAPLFPKLSAEEQFVRHQIAWRRELDRLIDNGDLVSVSNVHVDPAAEEEVVIIYTPNSDTTPHVQTSPRKQDERIFLRLIEFDHDIEQTEFLSLLDDQSEIPVREVIVRAQLCRSIMDLGQKNINFGMVERNERHIKSILLHNRSETSLLYAIRKSGSIASGDIKLGAGRYGVVRAFGKREIEFVFEPTLPGNFMEKLTVENIRDRSNDQVVSLKAMVRKPSTFFIESLELAFGPCLVDQMCPRAQTIVLTNTNKQSRMFEVRVDPNEAIFGGYFGEFDFLVEDADDTKLTKEAEEEIENLEQKLKIAKRKDQPDKIAKYLKKLAKLKDNAQAAIASPPTLPSTNADLQPPAASSSSAVASPVTSLASAHNKPPSGSDSGSAYTSSTVFRKTDESVVFPLDPQATKTVTVYFKPVLRPVKPDQIDLFSSSTQPANTSAANLNDQPYPVKGRILAHEYKNTDACKSVMYTALICPNVSDYRKALVLEGQSQNTNTSLPPSTSPPASTLPSSPPTVSSTSSSTSTCQPPTSLHEPEDPIALERSSFDGGRMPIDTVSPLYVRVTNHSAVAVPVRLVVPPVDGDFFLLDETHWTLNPNETRKIHFGIRPNQVGKQEHSLGILNETSQVMHPFVLHCLAHRLQYLSFPSLSEDTNGELDLGFSYVDPGNKYSQVTPLLVKNDTGEDLCISCQSNLSHQVLIFMDESGERGLVDKMPFKAHHMATVWVAVQPNLLTNYVGNLVDECRELVGGIKFSIFNDSGDLVLNQTVKFTSIIGQSHLHVSHRVINLGYTDLLQEEFYGSFMIENRSAQLPLDYEVECTSGNIVIDRRGGTLNGWKDSSANPCSPQHSSQPQHHLTPSSPLLLRRSSTHTDTDNDSIDDYGDAMATSLANITFRIYSHRYGLLNERLVVTNLHNSKEVFEIEVRLFVDAGKLDLLAVPSRQPPLDHLSFHNQHREAYPLRVVRWESIYAYAKDKGSDTLDKTTQDTDQSTFDNNGCDGQVNRDDTNSDEMSQTVCDQLEMIQLPSEDELRLYLREVLVANTSGQPMYLVAASDVEIKTSWQQVSSSSSQRPSIATPSPSLSSIPVIPDTESLGKQSKDLTNLPAPFMKCGDMPTLVQPGQRVKLQLYCPSVSKLSNEQQALTLQGHSGTLRGMIVLYDQRQQVEVLALELEAQYCVSLASLPLDRIDMGKIGHVHSWKPSKFQFTVHNMADVPLVYTLQAAPLLSFVPLDRKGLPLQFTSTSTSTSTSSPTSASSPWSPASSSSSSSTSQQRHDGFYVPAGKSQLVEGCLDPLQTDHTAGQRRYDVRILNLRNPHNRLLLRLKALMTTFELSFDRLDHGILVLPTLQYPIANHNCDSWFIIRNTTDDDIRFEIGVDLEPLVAEYIKFDVLSRYSNSPLRGGITLSPQGQMEIRVRATPSETMRLPKAATQQLDDDQMLLLGHLWVTTLSSQDDQTFREVIPVKCILEEVPMFTLSERRLEFRLATTYYQLQDLSSNQSSPPPSIFTTPRSSATFSSTHAAYYAPPQPQQPSAPLVSLPSHSSSSSVASSSNTPAISVPESYPLLVSNLASQLPLRLQVSIEGPTEFSADQLIDISDLPANNVATIAAGDCLSLTVSLANPDDNLPEQIKIHFDDLDAVHQVRQTATVTIKEIVRDI